MSKQNVLVVAAHPDDEVLGCGATIAKHAANGDRVSVLLLADGVSSRNSNAEQIEQRYSNARLASQILGAEPPQFLGFADNRLDGMQLLDIVQAVEKVIAGQQPSIIYTHHGGDLNIDHRLTHQAVLTACRPQPGNGVRAIYCFETLSSSEWGSEVTGPAFTPHYFVAVNKTADKKIQALEVYAEEMRDFPHARSLEAVQAQMRLRGTSVGVEAAEAFMVARLIND